MKKKLNHLLRFNSRDKSFSIAGETAAELVKSVNNLQRTWSLHQKLLRFFENCNWYDFGFRFFPFLVTIADQKVKHYLNKLWLMWMGMMSMGVGGGGGVWWRHVGGGVYCFVDHVLGRINQKSWIKVEFMWNCMGHNVCLAVTKKPASSTIAGWFFWNLPHWGLQYSLFMKKMIW